MRLLVTRTVVNKVFRGSQSTRRRPEVHILYMYKQAQCIARMGVNDMRDLCGPE